VCTGAADIIAWLGEEGEESDLAFEAINTLPKSDQVHWDAGVTPSVGPEMRSMRHVTALQSNIASTAVLAARVDRPGKHPWERHALRLRQPQVFCKVVIFAVPELYYIPTSTAAASTSRDSRAENWLGRSIIL